MSSKKDFGRKQQLKNTKCYDRDYFCDTIDEIMLVREAVEFNSSVEPNNVREFYMAFMVWCQTRCICKMLLYLSARTLTTICPCLDAVVKNNDCWGSFFSMNATMTNPFVTLIQIKLICFSVPLAATFSASSHSQCIHLLTNFTFSKYGHSFFTVKNVNKTFISKKIGNAY